MKKTAQAETPLAALEEQYGKERFPGILTLSFFEAFWGILSERTPALPLYAFLPEETEPNRLQVLQCKGWAGTPAQKVFYVSVQDLLCASALSGIPLLISHERSASNLAEDFMRALFGLCPLSRLPLLQEEGNAGERPSVKSPGFPASEAPLLLDADALSEQELKILKYMEEGKFPSGGEFPAVFILGNRFNATGRHPLHKNFFNLTIPCLPPCDAFPLTQSQCEATGFNSLPEGLMERASHYLETGKEGLQDIEEHWPACYAMIARTTINGPAFTEPTLEWFHLTANIFAGEHKFMASQEAGILIQWLEEFGIRGLTSLPELERQVCLNEGGSLFQDSWVPLSPADLGRIYKLAPFFTTLNRIRLSLSSPASLEAYFESPASVLIQDLFISFYVIISERSAVEPHELESTLNSLVGSYYEILDLMASLPGFERESGFRSCETSVISGVSRCCLSDALEQEGGVAVALRFLLKTGKKMMSLLQPEPCARNFQLAWLMTDIFSLAGFFQYYRKELDLIINCFGPESSMDEVIAGLQRFFHEKKKSDALTIPPIFLQRIPRVLR